MRYANSSLLALLLALAIPAAGAAGTAGTAEVAIRNYAFEPAELRVKAGTTVVWSNRERRVSHSIRFLGKDGFESERFFPDESWQHTFTTPGTYAYSCGPHPEMHGTIVVGE